MLPIAILAGGFATRLGEFSKNLPKSLIDINGRPFVDWQMELLADAGYTKFIFCLSHKSTLIQGHLGDGSKFGVQIKYSLDGDAQLGTGGAIKKALPLLGSKFAVIYGDSYLPIDFNKVEKNFIQTRAQALMTVYRNEGSFDSSNVEFVKGQLTKYDKKNTNPRMFYIDYGLSYFQNQVFDTYPSDTSFDLSEVSYALSQSKKLSGFEVFRRFYEIGSVSGIRDLSTALREGNI